MADVLYGLSIPEQLNYFSAASLKSLPEVPSQHIPWRKNPEPTVGEMEAHTSILKIPQEDVGRGASHYEAPSSADPASEEYISRF